MLGSISNVLMEGSSGGGGGGSTPLLHFMVNANSEPAFIVLDGSGTINVTDNGNGTWDVKSYGHVYHFQFDQSNTNDITKVTWYVDELTSLNMTFYRWTELINIQVPNNTTWSNVKDWGSAFSMCTKLSAMPIVDITGAGNAVTGPAFIATWHHCESLVDFPNLDFSYAVKLERTWDGCSSLTSFPLLDFRHVEDFTRTWSFCNGLTSFPEINTSSGVTFSETWSECSSLTDFPLLDFSHATTFYATWWFCSSLISFPQINTSNVIIMDEVWDNCTGLTSFPLINTENVISMDGAWFECSNLTSFPKINASNCTSFSTTWDGCSSLTVFPEIDTSSGINFYSTWYRCYSLECVPSVNTTNQQNTQGIFDSCPSLIKPSASDIIKIENGFNYHSPCSTVPTEEEPYSSGGGPNIRSYECDVSDLKYSFLVKYHVTDLDVTNGTHHEVVDANGNKLIYDYHNGYITIYSTDDDYEHEKSQSINIQGYGIYNYSSLRDILFEKALDLFGQTEHNDMLNIVDKVCLIVNNTTINDWEAVFANFDPNFNYDFDIYFYKDFNIISKMMIPEINNREEVNLVSITSMFANITSNIYGLSYLNVEMVIAADSLFYKFKPRTLDEYEYDINNLAFLKKAKKIKSANSMFMESGFNNIDMYDIDFYSLENAINMFADTYSVSEIRLGNIGNTVTGLNIATGMFENCMAKKIEIKNIARARPMSGDTICNHDRMYFEKARSKMFKNTKKLEELIIHNKIDIETRMSLESFFESTNLKYVSMDMFNFYKENDYLYEADMCHLANYDGIKLYKFCYQSNIEKFNMSNLEYIKIINMSYMLFGSQDINEVITPNNILLSNGQAIDFAFANLSKLKELILNINLTDNTQNNFTNIIYNTPLEVFRLHGVSYFDTSNPSEIIHIDPTNIKKVEITSDQTGFSPNYMDISGAFMDATNLEICDISGLKANTFDIASLFARCEKLKYVELPNNLLLNSNAQLNNVFEGCKSLVKLPDQIKNLNTQNVTSMDSMFANCVSLAEIDVSGYRIDNLDNMTKMFYNVPFDCRNNRIKFWDYHNAAQMITFDYAFKENSYLTEGELFVDRNNPMYVFNDPLNCDASDFIEQRIREC